MAAILCRHPRHCHGLRQPRKKGLEERGRRSALFPLPMLGLAASNRLASVAGENAHQPSHLVGVHCTRRSAAGARAAKQALGSLSCFLRLFVFRLLAVSAPFFGLPLAPATLRKGLLDHGAETASRRK